jgi:hypothetical protein
MKCRLGLSFLSLVLLLATCQPQSGYEAKVTRVNHTPVKRQAIGNCWLYAHATWFESLLKQTTGEDINASESYWTYWDFYEKLLAKEAIPEGELNTSGSWYRSSTIIRKYGWLEEGEFIAFEAADVMSMAQDCGEAYLIEQGKPGGTLADLNQRTPEIIRTELDKAFSCNGTIRFNMAGAFDRRRKAEDTLLSDVKSGQQSSLVVWLNLCREISSPADSAWGLYEGKKLGSPSELDGYKSMEQRIKKAWNDHQPLVLTFLSVLMHRIALVISI